MLLFTTLALATLALPAFAFPPSLAPRSTTVGSSNSSIKWVLCPDTPNDSRETTFYCSSLRVPLNWIDPIPGVEADLFLRMYPADEGLRTGSLLLNAGGPGGSTSAWVLQAAPSLSLLGAGTLDLIGMDPRGVNLTFPNMRAGTSDFKNALFDLANPPIRVSYDPSVPFNLTDPAVFEADKRNFDDLLARQELVAQSVWSRTTEDERRSVSTAFAARDFAALVDALGDEDGLLHYYGVSYGTVIGATFAAMFPQKVGRMVLDGVVDSPAYLTDALSFAKVSAAAADEVATEFYRLCALGGPTRCPLASSDNLTAEAGAAFVASGVSSLFHQLYENPLPSFDAAGVSSLVHVSDVYSSFRQALYSPITWQPVSAAIALALAGNTTLLRQLVPATPDVVLRGDQSLANENVFNRTSGGDVEVTQSIYCIDQAEDGVWATLKNGTSEEWVTFSAEIRNAGHLGAEIPIALAQGCRVYKDVAFERFTGPFSVKDGLQPLRNPILFVGNTHDPITPLSSARKMAEGFEDNASLLIQDGRGHVSLAEASTCTISAIQSYLVNGTLPAFGTVCPVDDVEQIFPSGDQSALGRRGVNELSKTARRLSELVASRRAGMFGLN